MKNNESIRGTKGLLRMLEDGDIPVRKWDEISDEEKGAWAKEYIDFMKHIRHRDGSPLIDWTK